MKSTTTIYIIIITIYIIIIFKINEFDKQFMLMICYFI